MVGAAVVLALGGALLSGSVPARPTPWSGIGHEEAGAPLGSPPVVAWDGVSRFGFEYTSDDGRPVAWSPCRPVHYVVNPAGGPARLLADTRKVADEVAAATGLTIVFDGLTSETAATGRASVQPALYGDRWAPVLIEFASAEQVPALAGPVTGLGVSAYTEGGPAGEKVLVTGHLTLDTSLLQEPSMSREPAYVAVLRHEWGHVLGLAHVDDSTQLMDPVVSAVRTFQNGDLYGLALLGGGVCAPHA